MFALIKGFKNDFYIQISMAIRLQETDMARILDVERKAFIPSIKATEEMLRKRLGKGHVYLGVESGRELIGTLGFRFAQFTPDFVDFCKRNPTFSDYAENDNEQDPNAIFIYSIGVIPQHRNGRGAKDLLLGVFNIAKQKGMDFLVGDARVPSYNGSNQNLQYEQFSKNEELHRAIKEYFKTGILPARSLIEQDPVAGFYLKIFQKARVLGITDNKFWEGDEPCGGHMAIEYTGLK